MKNGVLIVSDDKENMVTQGYSGSNALCDGPLSSEPLPTNDAQYQDQAQFESDKRAVYKHPLFPLLALLFEKCEIATQTSPESPMSDSFHHDLEAFVQHQERDRKPFLANDPEVDGLMIKAIQVLRIHLLELDKVQELCKDFCTRYITCLKGKMQSENLLRSDYYDVSASNGSAMLTSSQSNSPHHSCYSSNGEHSVSPSSAGNIFHHSGLSFTASEPPCPPALMNNNNNNASPEHSTSSSQHSRCSPVLGVHGSTPLSQIGANNSSNSCPTASGSQQDSFLTPNSPSSGEDDDDYLGRKKAKRGVLPKHATSIMRSWLFQHIVHPYPTEDEKRQIAAQTNLTLLQVNNWFINARRRILQPMLDASTPETSSPPKAKKQKTNGSNKPALKYWTDNLSRPDGDSPESGMRPENGGGDSSESDGESENDNSSDSSRH